MDYLYYVVIGVSVGVTCFVIGGLVNLDQVIRLKIFGGKGGQLVQVMDLRG